MLCKLNCQSNRASTILQTYSNNCPHVRVKEPLWFLVTTPAEVSPCRQHSERVIPQSSIPVNRSSYKGKARKPVNHHPCRRTSWMNGLTERVPSAILGDVYGYTITIRYLAY